MPVLYLLLLLVPAGAMVMLAGLDRLEQAYFPPADPQPEDAATAET